MHRTALASRFAGHRLSNGWNRLRAAHVICGCLLLILGHGTVDSAFAEELDRDLSESLKRGGLCVQLGGGDGASTLTLARSGRALVHRLESDPEHVKRTRTLLDNEGLYGVATVQLWNHKHLPYANNLVTTLVVDEPAGVDREELLRVLAPGGVAFVRSGASYTKVPKPRPEGMDEWTHQWHGADGNLASQDQLIGIPNGLQWLAGPLFPTDGRKSSARGLLTANGRIFYITQNHAENMTWKQKTRPDHLIARDAFSGLPLWQREWTPPAVRATPYASMVVVDDRLFGVNGEDFVALDAATGKTLVTFDTESLPEKILYEDGLLVTETKSGLSAYNLETGSRAWTASAANPYGTVVDEGRVFCISGSRQDSGKWLHEVLCFDLAGGRELWRHPTESQYSTGQSPMLAVQFAASGIVCLVETGILQALSQETGVELWRHSTDAFGRGGWDTRFVGHFYSQGLVWMRKQNADKSQNGQEVWLGLEPQTGETRRVVKSSGSFPNTDTPAKIGCQPFVATDRFIIFSRQVTCIDLESGVKDYFKFARGGCTIGVVPANGLAYVPVHACGCFSEALRGFLALTSDSTRGISVQGEQEPAFVKGPAYGIKLGEESDAEQGWSTFRGNARRSAHTAEAVPARLKTAWQTTLAQPSGSLTRDEWQLRVGAVVTPPAVVGDRVFVAVPDSHRVVSLDAERGDTVWQFTADGRVDSPPTIFKGLCLFGSHDGWVYCLRADDGQLVWRRRVAPHERRIVAYGQVESSWPVAGSVLVHNGLVFAGAGRGPDADGGVFVAAIQPDSGDVVWSRNVTDGYGTSDILVSDGQYVYLMNRRLNPENGEFEEQFRPWDWRYREFNVDREEPESDKRPPYIPTAFEQTSYLADGKSGLLEATWIKVPLALRRAIHDMAYQGTAGLVLSFTDDKTFGYRIVQDRNDDTYCGELFCNANPSKDGDSANAKPARRTASRRRTAAARSRTTTSHDDAFQQVEKVYPQDHGRSKWMLDVPMSTKLTALVSTPDLVFAAGANETEGEPGQLWSISGDDGKTVDVLPLPAAPILNGMAAANGRLYVVTDQGEVICYEGR